MNDLLQTTQAFGRWGGTPIATSYPFVDGPYAYSKPCSLEGVNERLLATSQGLQNDRGSKRTLHHSAKAPKTMQTSVLFKSYN